jgi:hypothetical protein
MAQPGANPGMGRPGPIPRLAKDKEEAEYLSTDPDAGEEIETPPEQYRQPQGFLENYLEAYGAMVTGESEGLEAQGRAGLTGLAMVAPAIGLPLATAAAPVLATKGGMGLTAAALALASGSSLDSAAAQSVAAGLGIPWAANTTLGRKILQGVARKLLGAEAAAAPAAAAPAAAVASVAPSMAGAQAASRVPAPSIPWRPPVGAAPNAATRAAGSGAETEMAARLSPPPVAAKPAVPKPLAETARKVAAKAKAKAKPAKAPETEALPTEAQTKQAQAILKDYASTQGATRAAFEATLKESGLSIEQVQKIAMGGLKIPDAFLESTAAAKRALASGKKKYGPGGAAMPRTLRGYGEK